MITTSVGEVLFWGKFGLQIIHFYVKPQLSNYRKNLDYFSKFGFSRYILIRHPNLYPRVYTRGSVLLMCLIVWIVMFGVTVPNHVDVGWGSLGFSDILFVCTFATDHYRYTLFLITCTIFFPAILTFIAYYGIYRQVRMSRIRVLTGKPGKFFRKDIRIVKSLFKTYVAYLLLILPFGVIMLVNLGPQLPHIWYMLSLLLFHGVGTANCFLYAVRLGKFWDGLRLMFRLPVKSESSTTSGPLSTASHRVPTTASSRRYYR
ncbi:melatonin receptor type 1A-like [Paramacrobiotus metropolitanus]|uniref:melatonin receptor type 1A-like n=1 Tax=Paramacrobiotus metropolitanus TaxID=2943436 RepID=UPI0024463285|nr:melatonin receptor type 1A-like [Paramacrobiotus metropolitanus]